MDSISPPEQAEMVTDIGDVFQGNTEITSFDEFKFFTSVHRITKAFNSTSLATIHIPDGLLSSRNLAFQHSNNLADVYIDSLEHWMKMDYGDAACNPCNTASHALLHIGGEIIPEVIVPESINQIGNWAFEGCYWLTKIVIPSHVVSIGNAFANCVNLAYPIVFNRDYQTLQPYTFYGCVSVPYYDFRKATIIPSMANINTFHNIPSSTRIVVPDFLYDEWIVATNWSVYADRIVRASEFVEPTNNE